jgi:ribosomal-protein-alanine N-acetyltransferase
MTSNYKIFETERLILRPTGVEDTAFILELMNTPKWIEFIGDRNIGDLEAARNYIITRIQSQFDKLGFGNYTIIRKFDQKKIGSCGLYDREGLEGIDIGFALLLDFEKQGYAFESVSKLKEAAFEEFGLTEISAITAKENVASQGLLTKLGLKFEKNINHPTKEDEILLYKLNKV